MARQIQKSLKPSETENFKLLIHAGDRNRTGTGDQARRILSPVRLPVPPRRHIMISHENGTYRARTCDPLLVRQMLSQLS